MASWFFISMAVQCVAAGYFMWPKQPDVALAYVCYGLSNAAFAWGAMR